MVKGIIVGTDETNSGMAAPPIAGREHAVASPLALPIGLAVMAVTLLLVVLAAQPPAPRPASAPASEFSAARAMVTLERLLGDGAAHPIGSQANAQIAARIGDELAAMGLRRRDAVDVRVSRGVGRLRLGDEHREPVAGDGRRAGGAADSALRLGSGGAGGRR